MSHASPDNTPKSQGWIQRLKDFFFDRLGLDAAVQLAAHKRVPIHGMTVFYFLGGMALFLFIVQVATGILLAFTTSPRPIRPSRAFGQS